MKFTENFIEIILEKFLQILDEIVIICFLQKNSGTHTFQVKIISYFLFIRNRKISLISMVQIRPQKLMPISIENMRDEVITKNHRFRNFSDHLLYLRIFFFRTSITCSIYTQDYFTIISENLMTINFMSFCSIYYLKIISKKKNSIWKNQPYLLIFLIETQKISFLTVWSEINAVSLITQENHIFQYIDMLNVVVRINKSIALF